MARQRRCIKSNHLYEVCFRTKEGLPFVATRYMKLILESVLARALVIHPVVICHMIWMSNHPHIFLIAKDSEQCKNFYGYIQKQLTEHLKRLFGLNQYNLWSGSPQVTEIADVQAAIERLVYFFNNPTKADLVDRIEAYPNINTWDILLNSNKDFYTTITKQAPRIKQRMVEQLPVNSMTEAQDKGYTNRVKIKAKKSHALTYYPYLWLKCFNVDPDSINHYVQIIVDRVRDNEDKFRKIRIEAGKRVLGAKRLALQDIRTAYKPTKFSDRKVFVIAADSEIRVRKIKEYQDFCIKCDSAYQAWKYGNYSVEWPLGCFRPPMPPTANVFVPL